MDPSASSAPPLMEESLDTPGARVALALHFSGFDVSELSADILQACLADSFEVHFEREAGADFVIAYDSQTKLIEFEKLTKTVFEEFGKCIEFALKNVSDNSNKKPKNFDKIEKTDLAVLQQKSLLLEDIPLSADSRQVVPPSHHNNVGNIYIDHTNKNNYGGRIRADGFEQHSEFHQ